MIKNLGSWYPNRGAKTAAPNWRKGHQTEAFAPSGASDFAPSWAAGHRGLPVGKTSNRMRFRHWFPAQAPDCAPIGGRAEPRMRWLALAGSHRVCLGRRACWWVVTRSSAISGVDPGNRPPAQRAFFPAGSGPLPGVVSHSYGKSSGQTARLTGTPRDRPAVCHVPVDTSSESPQASAPVPGKDISSTCTASLCRCTSGIRSTINSCKCCAPRGFTP